METIKNAIGLTTPAQQSGQEPVNASQGAGTAAEPYDAGNQDENVPAVTDAAATTSSNVNAEGKAVDEQPSATNVSDTKAPGTVPGTSPVAAAVVSDGTEATDVGTSSAAANDSVPAPLAVGASTTKTADELGKTSAADNGAKATPTETKPVTTDKKDTTIGTAGWFKNTLQRRKSKGKPLETETEKGPKVPEKDTPPKKSASVGIIEPTKKQETPVAAATEKKETKPTKETKEKKHKRGKSVSETLKSANPFKRRQSKNDTAKEEASKHETKQAKDEGLTALPLVPEAQTTDKSTAAAVPATDEKPVTTAAASDVPPSTNALAQTTTYSSRYADEEIAPDELPSVTASKDVAHDETAAEKPTSTSGLTGAATTATTTTEKSEPTEQSTSNTAVPADPVVSTTAEEAAPVEPAASTATDKSVPAEPATTTSATTAATDDVTAADPSPKNAVEEPHVESAVPVINEPAVESNKAGKSPVVEEKLEHASPKGENLSAIPTAGGIRLGTRAMEERRVSQDIRRKSFVPADISEPAAKAVESTAAPEAKATQTNHTAADGAPTRRLSVFGKLKEKLKN